MKALLIFGLTLVIICASPRLAKTQTIYTIQVASISDLESARELAERISHILPLPVRLEKSLGKLNAVRAGAAEDKEDLILHLNTLKKAGYLESYLRRISFSKEDVILEIPPSIPSSRSSEKKETRSPLLTLNQKEQVGTGLIQKPEEKPKDGVSPPSPKPQDEGRQFLDAAWQNYKAGSYTKAISWFKTASLYPETSLEAKLGLAYSYLKLKENKESLSLFEELVKKQFSLNETLPNLISLLLQKGDYDKATLYVAKLRGKEKEKWERKIEEARLNREFNQVKNEGSIEKLTKFTQKYKDDLNHCLAPGAFYNTAQILAEGGAKDKAMDIYNSLLSACPNSWDLRLGIFYELKPQLPFTEMKMLVEKETQRKGSPIAYNQKLSVLELNLLKERIATIPPSSPEVKKLADEILAIQPEDPSALVAIGWWHYHEKRYRLAYETFQSLYKKYPEEKGYALGLIYALIELNEDEEALDLARKSRIDETETRKIESLIYLRKANESYENKDYAEAENYIQKLLAIDPENRDAKDLLAWTLYNQEKFEAALPLFFTAYEKQKNSEIAEVILYTYEKLGQKKNAFNFSHEIAKDENESLREVSGNYFLSQDMPITAAQIYDDPKTPYYNADKPSLESTPFFRHKSGSAGLSELNEVAIPINFSYPFKWGNNIGFSFITEWLSSGDAPSSAFVGNFSSGETPERDLIESLWVFTPEISLEREGYIHYEARLGTTPLNGPVFPLPTFFAEAEQKHWRFNIHQQPIRESILSYVGLEDPFSDREWGRVLRTGAEAEVVFTPFSSYWISLIAGYDYYWGKNVKGNNALQGTMSFGRVFTRSIGTISLGFFITGKHFSRNLDFFTFGQGGYFSPDIFLMTGPTVRFLTKPYKSFWLEVQAAVGFLYFRTDDSPFFPLRNGDSGGVFEGETSSRLGFNGQLEGLKLFTPHLAGGVFGSTDRNADYTEWSAGLTLRYYFNSRLKLLSQQNNKPWSSR